MLIAISKKIYYDSFETKGKLKIFYLKISRYFVEPDELILKLYTVLVFETVFHKLIKENWRT
jgi:hypothetical protein